MKLIYRIISRLSIALSVVLALWAVFFYYAIIDEVNDEADDLLEEYSEQILIRFLAGEEFPSAHTASNNQYYLNKVTPEYARTQPHISYMDSMVYIPEKRETEPARILTTIYKDDGGQYYELTVSTPTFEKEDLKESILYWIIFLYVGLLFVLIVVNIWVYNRSTRPLHILLAWMDQYNVGGRNEPLRNETNVTIYRQCLS